MTPIMPNDEALILRMTELATILAALLKKLGTGADRPTFKELDDRVGKLLQELAP